MTQPSSSITVSPDGQSIKITNCDIEFSSGFDPSTGAGTITITPYGGLGTLPGVLQGQQGPAPVLNQLNVVQLAAGQALPVPNGSFDEVSPGVYNATWSVNAGAQGAAGANAISEATDLSGTATNNATLIWNALTNQFEYAPQAIGKLYGPSTISSVSGAGGQQGQPQVMATISVPAWSFNWFPVVTGQAVVNGTANTQVMLSANLSSTSGDQVSVGYGVTGLTQQLVALQSTIPAGASGTYGEITAGSTATIVISATQTGNTTDGWSIDKTWASFSLMIFPVASS